MNLPPQPWSLPTNHPHLCPGEGQETYLREPYSEVRCPLCRQYPVPGHRANVPGGGRVGRHYRPDIAEAYSEWFDLPHDQRRWPPDRLFEEQANG